MINASEVIGFTLIIMDERFGSKHLVGIVLGCNQQNTQKSIDVHLMIVEFIPIHCNIQKIRC